MREIIGWLLITPLGLLMLVTIGVAIYCAPPEALIGISILVSFFVGLYLITVD